MEWIERARSAERRGDVDAAIALVGAHAECSSADHHLHDNHLWHMSLLARAERFSELTRLALTDVHARRRLNRALGERGVEPRLRGRARDGDRDALYVLVRLLCQDGRDREADRVIEDLAPDDRYAREIVDGFRSPVRDLP